MKIHLQYINDVHIKVIADAGIVHELADHFTYKAENYKWHPSYRAKKWNGDISLVNRLTGICYAGLAHRIKKFCNANDYTLTFDDELFYDNVSVEEVRAHIASLNIPDWLEIRDYQVESVVKCLRTRRRLLLSPTSSGKSFMIYLMLTWYKKKTLIIVPSLGLVQQFEDDLRSYGYKGKIHMSTDGNLKNNNIDADVVISTWQSIDNGKSRLPASWFGQFEVVFGDEAHGAKAKTIIKILSNMTHTRYRFGTTGTLGNIELNNLTIEGLFGPQYTSTTTRELIDDGYASDIKIKVIVLRYPEEVRKEFNKTIKDPKTEKFRKKTYQEEVEWINLHAGRTKFIQNLAKSLKGNKIIFFRQIEHGKSIYNGLAGTDDVFFIDGSVKDRERIRKAIEENEDAILVASVGTTSTGISIRKLHHMILASLMKGKIKLLQSIGRMLRQHKEKTHAVMYDIVDDLSWKNSKNYALLHFEERAKNYDLEKFDYKIYQVGL